MFYRLACVRVPWARFGRTRRVVTNVRSPGNDMQRHESDVGTSSLCCFALNLRQPGTLWGLHLQADKRHCLKEPQLIGRCPVGYGLIYSPPPLVPLMMYLFCDW